MDKEYLIYLLEILTRELKKYPITQPNTVLLSLKKSTKILSSSIHCIHIVGQ